MTRIELPISGEFYIVKVIASEDEQGLGLDQVPLTDIIEWYTVPDEQEDPEDDKKHEDEKNLEKTTFIVETFEEAMNCFGILRQKGYRASQISVFRGYFK